MDQNSHYFADGAPVAPAEIARYLIGRYGPTVARQLVRDTAARLPFIPPNLAELDALLAAAERAQQGVQA